MKKIISVSLAIIIALSSLAVFAFAASEYQTYYITYEISDEKGLLGETNVEIVPLAGYNNYVLGGEDFKFTVETSEDYSDSFIIVHANTLKLEPDIHGVYTISEIREDQTIRVSFSLEEEQSNMFASLIVFVRSLFEMIVNMFNQLFSFAA